MPNLTRCLSLVVLLAAGSTAGAQPTPPNILWITSEDNGPQLGCYGDRYATTPNLDAFAAKSLRYKMAWSNAPVCAPARTTIISGMYACALGAEHMRSGVTLPENISLYPKLLKQAGYYCVNNVKTDYNFSGRSARAGWDAVSNKAHWRNRPDKAKPFMAVFNLTISHESQIRNQPHRLVHDPAMVRLPAYHPDQTEVRRDWAQYYDRLTEMDTQVGKILAELAEDNLQDSTIVFYYGDHGCGMPRSKRWPFNSGLQVPMILHVPEVYQSLAPGDYTAGGASDRLVSFVDLAPTLMSLAGVDVPENMQGSAFAGSAIGPAPELLHGFRGRMDERYDMARSATDGRYVYLRHFYPELPYLKHVEYMFETPTTRVWKAMFDAGKLNPIQAAAWQPKPVEELFDLRSDPDETVNLVDDPDHQDVAVRMRAATRSLMTEIGDLGIVPEAMMHELAADSSPRQYQSNRKADWPLLVDTAWSATENWRACSEASLAPLFDHVADDDPVMRYWCTRGLSLGLQSHGTILSSDTVGRVTTALGGRLGDSSSNVVIAAAEALLCGGDQAMASAATQTLIEQAGGSQFASIAALNVLDQNVDRIPPSLRTAAASIQPVSQTTNRGSKEQPRLVNHLRAQLASIPK